MYLSRFRITLMQTVCLLLVLVFSLSGVAAGQKGNAPVQIRATQEGLRLTSGDAILDIQVVEDRVIRVYGHVEGKTTPRTLVMDPHPVLIAPAKVDRKEENGVFSLQTRYGKVSAEARNGGILTFADAEGHVLLRNEGAMRDVGSGNVRLFHAEGETLYGMRGLPMEEDGAGLMRNGGATIAAGVQGNSGAPFTFTLKYGVLFDSDGGQFITRDENFSFKHCSRPDVEYFVMIGPPMETMASLSRLVGPPPMPPKWTLGFMNSQWGADQKEVEQIIATYRQKKLPIDGFIFDFDWKAWGEDNYGEWRWNSTSGPGSVYPPDKFPDGASGLFAKLMDVEGIKLGGILKPRILYNAPGSTTKLTEAAAYAEKHHFWYPKEIPTEDYFTHRDARNLDFNNPEMRAWFWEHLIPAFKTGIVAWWNDEADYSATTIFNNFQFLNMGRALYEGQRNTSNLRVWSINRNFYLGSSRYGYAGWSGDVGTGFASMAFQRRRMLAALNTGEFDWSMDTGGFGGHPVPENYARWMEFAAFVPIMRVHGDHNEKRQPWVYGPVAEEASRVALNLRYSLLPYIYSYQRLTAEGKIGLIRPLMWQFPDDGKAVANDTEWMFGDALLVSPVVKHGEREHALYLPQGAWFDYATGKRYEGGNSITIPVDSATWKDIPLFVRRGSILATQPVQQWVGQAPVEEITLDVFPAEQEANFVAYDDDGQTYNYEKNGYMRQPIHVVQYAGSVEMSVDASQGTYKGSLKSYLIRIHAPASKVSVQGSELTRKSGTDNQLSLGKEWMEGQDRFGSVTSLRVPAGATTSTRITVQ